MLYMQIEHENKTNNWKKWSKEEGRKIHTRRACKNFMHIEKSLPTNFHFRFRRGICNAQKMKECNRVRKPVCLSVRLSVPRVSCLHGSSQMSVCLFACLGMSVNHFICYRLLLSFILIVCVAVTNYFLLFRLSSALFVILCVTLSSACFC